MVYEWLTSSEFLIRAIVPDGSVITAKVDDDPEHVLGQLPADAAVLLFHLNCTRTERFPFSRANLKKALIDRGVTILNDGATDISKRAIQARCAKLGLFSTLTGPTGDEDETIIVKTNLNFGGTSEWALSAEERIALGLGTGSTLIYNPNNYMVLRRGEVDPAWWTDENLVCERYVTNPADRWYRAYWLLARLVVCERTNPLPIKKIGQSRLERVWRFSVEAGTISKAPDGLAAEQLVGTLLRFIEDAQLDFGTIDLVEDDRGRYYVIDVNTTPAYNYPTAGLVEYLREALQ